MSVITDDEGMRILDANFTNREWKVSVVNSDVLITDYLGNQIAVIKEFLSAKETYQNARLVAASPLLLDMAREFLLLLEAMGGTGDKENLKRIISFVERNKEE